MAFLSASAEPCCLPNIVNPLSHPPTSQPIIFFAFICMTFCIYSVTNIRSFYGEHFQLLSNFMCV